MISYNLLVLASVSLAVAVIPLVANYNNKSYTKGKEDLLKWAIPTLVFFFVSIILGVFEIIWSIIPFVIAFTLLLILLHKRVKLTGVAPTLQP